MEIIIALVISVILAFALRKPLEKVPWVVYLVAIVLDAIFLSNVIMQANPPLGRALFPYFQRGILSFGLLSVVMFIGVFSYQHPVRRYLQPVRGELSVFASILICGHVVNYLTTYLTPLFAGFAGVRVTTAISIIISIILSILLAILAVTSLRYVRRTMNAKTWKSIQRWAYVFYGLTFVHMFFILIPAVSVGAQRGVTSMIIYAIIAVVYVVARLMRYRADKAAKAEDEAQAA